MSEEKSEKSELTPETIRVVRLGNGANCSSIGSVVDTLFASAVVGSAILATVLAAMSRERVTVVGGSAPARADGERSGDDESTSPE